MNNLKKILFVIAIVAVIASCMALAVGAEYTTDNYDSILEYYEPMFAYEKFDDKEAGAYTDGIINEWSSKQLTEIVADGDNKYLTLSTTSYPFYSSNLFLNMNADASERLLLSFKVKGDRLDYDGGLPVVSVYAGHEALDTTADAANSHNEGICFIKLDFNTGEVKYYTNRLRDYIALEGFTLSENTWYNVDVIYNVVDGGYSISVTNSENEVEQAFKGDIRIPFGYDIIENVRIGMSVDDVQNAAQSSVLSLDDVFVYSGTFYRDPTAKYDQTSAAFGDFIKIIENPEIDVETKMAVLGVYERIVDELGYTAADNDEVTKGYIETLRVYSAMMYVDYVAEYTDFMDTNGDYATRRANLDSVKAFYDAIPDDYSFLSTKDAARLERVKAAYDEEAAYLLSVENDCIKFLEVYADVNLAEFNYEDYVSVNGVYENVIGLSMIDFTYPGMYQFTESYKKIISNRSRIYTSSVAFLESMASFEAADNFEDIYSYYRAASDVKETYINETYPGVADALAKLNDFVVNTDIVKLEEDCTNFILYVSRADFALYLSEKSKHYDTATPYFSTTYEIGEYVIQGVGECDCVEGVADAKVLYNYVAEYILHATEAATRYIEAVIALDGLTGSQLEEAVISALILKAEGDIEGFELVKDGVTYKMAEINVKLSELSTQISLANGVCKQFITYVNMIGKANNITDRYTYIRRALAIKTNIDVDAEGVGEAIALLDAEIVAYRDYIAGVNKSVSGGTAADSSSAVKSRAKTVAPRVVAFVGSYGKEEQ